MAGSIYLRYLGPSHRFRDDQSETTWDRYGEAQAVTAEVRDRVQGVRGEQWEEVKKDDADSIEDQDPHAEHTADAPLPESAQATAGVGDLVAVTDNPEGVEDSDPEKPGSEGNEG